MCLSWKACPLQTIVNRTCLSHNFTTDSCVCLSWKACPLQTIVNRTCLSHNFTTDSCVCLSWKACPLQTIVSRTCLSPQLYHRHLLCAARGRLHQHAETSKLTFVYGTVSATTTTKKQKTKSIKEIRRPTIVNETVAAVKKSVGQRLFLKLFQHTRSSRL